MHDDDFYNDEQLIRMQELTDYHLKKHPDKQRIQCLQELLEFGIALTKYEQTRITDESLLDELFDIDFMIKQMKRLFLNNAIDVFAWKKIVDAKLDREIKRHDLQ